MNTRLSIVAATAALTTLPLLAGCGGGTTTTTPASAPASQAAPSASTSPASDPTSAAPTPSSEPTVDKAKETKAASSATKKFVTVALTIGYPDKTYDDYLDRLKPLMTDRGFSAAKKSQTADKANKGLRQTYARKLRTTPKIKSDVTVSDLTADSATTKLTYANQIQQKVGGDWKTVKTNSTDTVTVRLVKQGSTWLVDDAR